MCGTGGWLRDSQVEKTNTLWEICGHEGVACRGSFASNTFAPKYVIFENEFGVRYGNIF